MRKTEALYREHRRIVEIMFIRGLTKSEKRRHASVLAKLDDIEMAQMRPYFERMEAEVEAMRETSEKLQVLINSLDECAIPTVDFLSRDIGIDDDLVQAVRRMESKRRHRRSIAKVIRRVRRRR